MSDGLTAIVSAAQTVYPAARHQRCLAHWFRNLEARTPRFAWFQRRKFRREFWWIWDAENAARVRDWARRFCARWRWSAPEMVEKFQAELEGVLAFFAFPAYWRHRLRTTNLGEGWFKHLRRYLSRFPGCRNAKHSEQFLSSHLNFKRLRGETTRAKDRTGNSFCGRCLGCLWCSFLLLCLALRPRPYMCSPGARWRSGLRCRGQRGPTGIGNQIRRDRKRGHLDADSSGLTGATGPPGHPISMVRRSKTIRLPPSRTKQSVPTHRGKRLPPAFRRKRSLAGASNWSADHTSIRAPRCRRRKSAPRRHRSPTAREKAGACVCSSDFRNGISVGDHAAARLAARSLLRNCPKISRRPNSPILFSSSFFQSAEIKPLVSGSAIVGGTTCCKYRSGCMICCVETGGFSNTL